MKQKGFRRQCSGTNWGTIPACLEGLRKTTKNLNNDSQHPNLIKSWIQFYDVSAKPTCSVLLVSIWGLVYKKCVLLLWILGAGQLNWYTIQHKAMYRWLSLSAALLQCHKEHRCICSHGRSCCVPTEFPCSFSTVLTGSFSVSCFMHFQ